MSRRAPANVPACLRARPCRQQALLATSQLQGLAKLLEDAAAGKLARAARPGSSGGAGGAQEQPQQDKTAATELARAAERQAQLVALVRGVQESAPGLSSELDRVLAHAAATAAWLPQPAV